jgi:hypothetical protein
MIVPREDCAGRHVDCGQRSAHRAPKRSPPRLLPGEEIDPTSMRGGHRYQELVERKELGQAA